ncbi:MAG: DUF3592 domain-containing protein [Oscillospiraceae bacterium]|nr:DUF3592 domain-containing protein [Oscillospiraceae bacterium]
MTYVLIAVIVIAVAVGAFFTIKRNRAIQQNGIEADAVVSRVVEHENQNDDGSHDVSYTYYVKYQTQDGQSVEAKLGNEPARIYEGMALRIKYLPEKPKYVVPAK